MVKTKNHMNENFVELNQKANENFKKKKSNGMNNHIKSFKHYEIPITQDMRQIFELTYAFQCDPPSQLPT